MKKIFSTLVLAVLIISIPAHAFALSGGGSFKKYSFGCSSTEEIEKEPEEEEKELPIQKGSKGEKVKEIQQLLYELGYLSGMADGIFGNGTKDAVSAFQSEKSLDITGIVDEETYEILLVAVQTKNEVSKFSFLDDMSREELAALRDELNVRLGEQPEEFDQEIFAEKVTSEPKTTKDPQNIPSLSPNNNGSSLTDMETEIFEWLINSISKFHAPASVRIVEVMGMKDDMYYITISADTLGGGTSNELYELKKYSCEKSMFVTVDKIKEAPFTLRESIYGEIPNSSECDVRNINNALKEYCAEKGWN